MPELHLRLTIAVPTHVHSGVLAEIDEAATQRDRTQADAIERWLGGLLSDAAATIEAKLPDGWSASFGSHYHADHSLEVGRDVYRSRQERYAADERQRRDDDDRRAAEGDEQRDYAEERFNRDLQREQ